MNQLASPSQIKSIDYSDLLPLRPTPVYSAFWRFATKRQSIYMKRLRGEAPPWTDDPILSVHRFTNPYRVTDRVSQYLIRNVIYKGSQDIKEVFFRIIIFKLFNRISTWELLERHLGKVTWADYSFENYDSILTTAMQRGEKIFSAAYIMPSGSGLFQSKHKHASYLKLVELMMKDGLPSKLARCANMRQGFELFRSYPMLGDFLSYQLITDINYSEITNFSESEFVIAGPGAKDGITKCFESLAGLSYEDIIRIVYERQAKEFERHGLNFEGLPDRPLQLIDIQNLFCEISKYARVAFPNAQGLNARTRIKQKFSSSDQPVHLWLPPKWGINEKIEHS